MGILNEWTKERSRRAQLLYDAAVQSGKVSSKAQAIDVLSRHAAMPSFARRNLETPEFESTACLIEAADEAADEAACDFLEVYWRSLPRWRRSFQRRSDLRDVDARAAAYRW